MRRLQQWTANFGRWSVLGSLLFGVAQADAAEPPAAAGVRYSSDREFLARHTQLRELVDDQGARLAICPQWQGRVMTSSCDGLEGLSFGFLNREFIAAGQHDPHFANYGGEDRFWLSPEGGQFSLWFKPQAPQDLQHWFTPPALNAGAWNVVSGPHEPRVRMQQAMKFQNASATSFDLLVTRDVRLVPAGEWAGLFGPAAAEILGRRGVRRVAYETVNSITNRGPALEKQGGLVSIWMLGMFNASPKTVAVVPYRPGSEAELGPVVKSDYFGPVPADRLKITPQAVLFRGDAQYRSKLGISQRRARNVLGSIDYQHGVLTLVTFTMPDDPTRHDYMNNMWEVPQKQPYVGDVVNSYNDGPPAPGKKGLGAFYEIESLSPAVALAPGQALTHHHRTVHVQAEMAVLAELARAAWGVDLDAVRKTMGIE